MFVDVWCTVVLFQPPSQPPTSKNSINWRLIRCSPHKFGVSLSTFVSRGEDCCCWEAEDFVDRPAAATAIGTDWVMGWWNVMRPSCFCPRKIQSLLSCLFNLYNYFVCGWLIVSNGEFADASLSYAFKRAKSCHCSEAFETAQLGSKGAKKIIDPTAGCPISLFFFHKKKYMT